MVSLSYFNGFIGLYIYIKRPTERRAQKGSALFTDNFNLYHPDAELAR